MKYIEHIIEPTKLLLSWQSSSSSNRGRYIVAELLRNGDDADLVYLSDSQDYIKAKEKGFTGEYPGFPATNKEHSGVLAAFIKRLPPRYRTDFEKFMDAIRIRPGTDISDFALLGYAGAKLPGDDFYIIHPFDETQPPFELLLLVAGYRYYRDNVPYEALKIGMVAKFEAEPSNPHDKNAIRIVIPEVADQTAGYVCRGLLPQFQRWLDAGWDIEGTIERINGVNDHPIVYLFVKVRKPT